MISEEHINRARRLLIICNEGEATLELAEDYDIGIAEAALAVVAAKRLCEDELDHQCDVQHDAPCNDMK